MVIKLSVENGELVGRDEKTKVIKFLATMPEPRLPAKRPEFKEGSRMTTEKAATETYDRDNGIA